MIRLKKILVPTDFSDFSHHAFRYGCELASRFQAELHLLHVVEDVYPVVGDPSILVSSPLDLVGDLQIAATEGLKKMVPSGETPLLVVHRHVSVGVAHLEIARFAEEQGCDLIVITTHGRSGLAHALLGSVSEKIVRRSPCPVLTVRPDGHNFVEPVLDHPEYN